MDDILKNLNFINKLCLLLLFTLNALTMDIRSKFIHENISYKVLKGVEVQTILPFIAEQRIKLFAEYPYLYKGTLEEENSYLSWFSNLKNTVVIVVYLESKPIGFITGTSFVDFEEHFNGSTVLFKNIQFDPQEFFYCAEVIVLPNYQGNKLSSKLFFLLESHAIQSGFKKLCFVTETHEEHPLKPIDYISNESIWRHLGYAKTNIHIHFNWETIQSDGDTHNQEHKLTYWIKDL